MAFPVRRSVAVMFLAIFMALGGAASAADILYPGQTLENGNFIKSLNGQYVLVMQSDGSLVMYRTTDGTVRYRMAKLGSYAIMQTDGNFVEYAGSTAIWNTVTGGWPGYWLHIYDNGDLKIEWFTASHSFFNVVWSIGADPVSDLTIVAYPMTDVRPSGTPPTCPFRGDYPPPPGC